jgi:peptidoglycan/LPS O-acetylase OafA/YrhL
MATDRLDSNISTGRRTELDWLRIGAFGLLILFHIGMFYVPWQWEVKSPRLLPWLQIPMDWSSPWRLLLLFVVSGAATRFMSVRLAPRELWNERTLRLLPPLLLAVVVLTPPQMYLRVIEQFDYQGSFGRFLLRYFSFDHGFCRPGDCLTMPNWNHLWFVAYLWIYTTLLLVVFARAPHLLARLKERAGRWLEGWRLLVVPALVLAMARIGLGHFFPETHQLLNDWYMHAIYFLAFLFGFLFIFSEGIWRGFEALRWPALAIAALSYAAHTIYALHYQGDASIPLDIKVPLAFVYGFEQWGWIVVAMGFGHRHLAGRDGPVRRYLTEGIFPYYIIHQPVIIIVAHELAKLRLPLALEATILIVVTVASCIATFELVRRVPLLRPWFGLKSRAAGRRPTSIKTGAVLER